MALVEAFDTSDTAAVAVDAANARHACVTDLQRQARLVEHDALVFDADRAFDPRSMQRAVGAMQATTQASAPSPRRSRFIFNRTAASPGKPARRTKLGGAGAGGGGGPGAGGGGSATKPSKH